MKTIKEVVANYISNLAKSNYTDMMFFAEIYFNSNTNYNCVFADMRTPFGYKQLLDCLNDVDETILQYQKHKSLSPYFLYVSNNSTLYFYTSSAILDRIEENKNNIADIMGKDAERYYKFWLRFGNNIKSIL